MSDTHYDDQMLFSGLFAPSRSMHWRLQSRSAVVELPRSPPHGRFGPASLDRNRMLHLMRLQTPCVELNLVENEARPKKITNFCDSSPSSKQIGKDVYLTDSLTSSET